MNIGPYKLSVIDAGDFMLDGGAMFGIVPKALWQKKIPADENNRIPMKTRLLLIQGEGRNILVDTGIGDKYDEKSMGIYRMNNTLEKSLAECGVSFGDITDVIITHLHFDHAGGNTRKDGAGKVVSAFPNAKYYVQKSQLMLARNPSARDEGSFMADDFEPIIEAGQMMILSGQKEIAAGVDVQVTMGHTDGQQHVLVSDGKTTLFYCADLIPTSAHIGPAWGMSYDLRPLVIMEEKRFILAEAAKNNWLLFFEHCPLMAVAHAKKTEKGFELFNHPSKI